MGRARVNSVTLGEQSVFPFYRDAHLFVDLRQQVVLLDSEAVRLTPMQYRMLALLVEHAGEIVPRPTLALWVSGRVLGPRSNMLDKHIRGLRRKLGVYADQYTETVHGTGYRFRSPALHSD
jgi:DNA-binding response OmpR family regulator